MTGFVAAEILGAPQAVRSGTATFVVGGPASARAALAPVWNVFAGVLDVGDRPQTAAIMKLLNTQMLLAQVAVIAETVRAGRAAGIDDTTLAATLPESKMMPEGLRNRIDVLFDPDHTVGSTASRPSKMSRSLWNWRRAAHRCRSPKPRATPTGRSSRMDGRRTTSPPLSNTAG